MGKKIRHYEKQKPFFFFPLLPFLSLSSFMSKKLQRRFSTPCNLYSTRVLERLLGFCKSKAKLPGSENWYRCL